MIPYSQPGSAARDAVELLDYLERHHAPQYVYRGQTREYAFPLFPSGYRFKRVTGRVYGSNSPEYHWSMRKVGRKFIGLHRFRSFDDIFLAYSGEAQITDTKEVETLQRIAHDDQATQAISRLGFEVGLAEVLAQSEIQRYKNRLGLWESILNRHHRALIRLNGCNE